MNATAAPLGAFAGYGIELEYMIVASDTLAVLPIADALFRKVTGSNSADVVRGRFAWSNELVLHLVELKNARPEARLDTLAAGFQAEVAHINALLAPLGAQLMPGAMHPWMAPESETRLWPFEGHAIYGAYDRVFGCRAHGWANIQSMHVNLPFADDEEFARLHAAVRLLLPILPALAASSPVAGGLPREALDFRLACYRHHTDRVPALMGRLIPENAVSRAAYEATVLAPMYREIAPLDPGGTLRHEWLNTRGAIARFDRNALEIRVLDLQEYPQADLAIAALVSAVTRALYEGRWSSLEAQRERDTAGLEALLLDCIRDADRAVIGDATYLSLMGFPGTRCEARELWRHLRDACAADPVLSGPHQVPLDIILEHGVLARRIREALGQEVERARLHAVYQALCDCLAAGRPFTGAGA